LRAATGVGGENMFPFTRGYSRFAGISPWKAQKASLHGQSAYTGAAILNDSIANCGFAGDVITLAADTGGELVFDTNDFQRRVYARYRRIAPRLRAGFNELEFAESMEIIAG